MEKYLLKNKNVILLALIFLLEFALFRTCVQREILGSCPRNIDQAVFMRMTYHMYENVVSGNYKEVLQEIAPGLGQGAFPVIGLIFLFLFGKSRLSLLLVNFVLFVLAQGIGFHYVKKMSGSYKIGWSYLGLFLMIQSPFLEAGGIFDYRMDFSAFCLYTCWMATFIAAHYLEDKKTYYLSAVFCGLVLMFRSNTLAYLGIAFALFECVFVFVLKQEKLKNEAIKLIKYIGITIVSGGWYILVQSQALIQYYLTAHVTSDEPEIRMVEQGITNFKEYILFYPQSLVNTHLGKTLFYILLFIIVVSIIGHFIYPSKNKIGKNGWSSLAAGACGFIAPFIVLTIDISKSAVVICTVAGTAVVITLLLFVIFIHRNSQYKRILCALAVLILGLGLWNYVVNTTKTLAGYEQDIQEEMLAINDCMREYLVDNDLSNVKLSFDRISDAITADVLTVLTYEQDNLYVDVGNAWGGYFIYYDYTKEEVEEILKETDLMVISKDGYAAGSYYPADESFSKYHDYMLEYCYDNLIQLGEFTLNGDVLMVFGKGQVKVASSWNDWMSDEGNWIIFNKQDERQNKIVIEGSLGGGFSSPEEFQPNVSWKGENIPCELSVNGDRYVITIDISDLTMGSYKMELSFNNSFIPAELGLNDDTRKLVVMCPDESMIEFGSDRVARK